MVRLPALPSEEEIRRAKEKKALQETIFLRRLQISPEKMDDTITSLSNRLVLPMLQQQRSRIIFASFKYFVRIRYQFFRFRNIKEAKDLVREFRRAIKQHTNPVDSLQRLRVRLIDIGPSHCSEQLWEDFRAALYEAGIPYASSIKRFYRYKSAPVHELIHEACDRMRQQWGHEYKSKPGIKKDDAKFVGTRTWIIRMADIYVCAGGQLPEKWASYDRSEQIHTGHGRHGKAFINFLISFYKMLPQCCHVGDEEGDEDAFGQQVEKAQLTLQNKEMNLPETSG